MKNRILTALLIAVLALPAFAQTNSAPPAQSQDQSQTQAQSTATQPAAVTTDSATGKPLQPPARQGFWGRLNPWARKKYVQRQVDPIRDRNNELDELTAANSKMIKDVDSRAQQGIQLASAKATEADQHAIDAGNKAQAAQQTAAQANTRLANVETVVGNIDQYKATNQTEIRFRPGQSVLSKNAKTALDELATPLMVSTGTSSKCRVSLRVTDRPRLLLPKRWRTLWSDTSCSITRFLFTASMWSEWEMLRSTPTMPRPPNAPAADAWKSAC
jgi:hypothetical protein